jgi:transposase
MKLRLQVPESERYSKAFRRQVVQEFELGGITKEGLKRKYQIGGKSTVLQRCRKYGRLAYPHLSYSMLTPVQMHQQQELPVIQWHKKPLYCCR